MLLGIGRIWPDLQGCGAYFGRIRPDFVRNRPNSDRIRPSSGRIRCKVDPDTHVGPKLARFWGNLPRNGRSCQVWRSSKHIRPTSAQILPTATGPNLVKVGLNWAVSGPVRQTSTEIGARLARALARKPSWGVTSKSGGARSDPLKLNAHAETRGTDVRQSPSPEGPRPAKIMSDPRSGLRADYARLFDGPQTHPSSGASRIGRTSGEVLVSPPRRVRGSARFVEPRAEHVATCFRRWGLVISIGRARHQTKNHGQGWPREQEYSIVAGICFSKVASSYVRAVRGTRLDPNPKGMAEVGSSVVKSEPSYRARVRRRLIDFGKS